MYVHFLFFKIQDKQKNRSETLSVFTIDLDKKIIFYLSFKFKTNIFYSTTLKTRSANKTSPDPVLRYTLNL